MLGSALGGRSTPYTEAEVWAAVGRVDLAIELCGARQFRSEDRLHYVADALLSAGEAEKAALETAVQCYCEERREQQRERKHREQIAEEPEEGILELSFYLPVST